MEGHYIYRTGFAVFFTQLHFAQKEKIMKSKYILLSFFGICLVQWVVLSGWILDSEKIINEGKYLKIRYLNPNNLYATNTNRNYLWITPDPNTIEFTDSGKYVSVSYTHLDVDKRQGIWLFGRSSSNRQISKNRQKNLRIFTFTR